jgi:hypothetical protein
MSDYTVGDVVLTLYGVGVIVQKQTPEDWNVVRLWRMPMQSVGSTSLAYLRPEAVSDPLSLSTVYTLFLWLARSHCFTPYL